MPEKMERIGNAVPMRFRWNVIIQGLAVAAQTINQIEPIVPEDDKPKVAIALGILQAGIGLLAHFVNPDGTKVHTQYKGK